MIWNVGVFVIGSPLAEGDDGT